MEAISPRTEADALLAVLRMAERHHKWPLMAELVSYIGEAGGRLLYLESGSYALALPGPLR